MFHYDQIWLSLKEKGILWSLLLNHLTRQLKTTPKSSRCSCHLMMKKMITEVMFNAETPWQSVDSAIKYHYRHPALTVCAIHDGVAWEYTLNTLVHMYTFLNIFRKGIMCCMGPYCTWTHKIALPLGLSNGQPFRQYKLFNALKIIVTYSKYIVWPLHIYMSAT